MRAGPYMFIYSNFDLSILKGLIDQDLWFGVALRPWYQSKTSACQTSFDWTLCSHGFTQSLLIDKLNSKQCL